MIYVDSSVLLELYLERPLWARAREILLAPEPKASSFVLMVEVPVVLRRTLSRRGDALGLRRCLERFDGDLDRISLTDSLTDAALRIRSDPRFADCRALDAIHACTALLLKEWTRTHVRVATFDRGLSALARDLGLV